MSTLVNRPKSPTAQVIEAIGNTPSEYWATLLCQRAGRGVGAEACGSHFPRMSTSTLHSFLLQLVWEDYRHPAIAEPARGFVARSVPHVGVLGIMKLSDVPERAEMRWSDPKNTGTYELVLTVDDKRKLPEVEEIVMLLGPGDNGRPVVWTFHPGAPIRPSQLTAEQVKPHATASKSEAAQLGIEWVKLEVKG